MTPSITVIRRRRHGTEYREERFRGRQFRCTKCNGIFAGLAAIERHLEREDPAAPEDRGLPEVDSRIDARLPYLSDLKQTLGERKKRKRDDR